VTEVGERVASPAELSAVLAWPMRCRFSQRDRSSSRRARVRRSARARAAARAGARRSMPPGLQVVVAVAVDRMERPLPPFEQLVDDLLGVAGGPHAIAGSTRRWPRRSGAGTGRPRPDQPTLGQVHLVHRARMRHARERGFDQLTGRDRESGRKASKTPAVWIAAGTRTVEGDPAACGSAVSARTAGRSVTRTCCR